MAVSRINEAGLNVNQYSNRNVVINGAMAVAQRGTSTTGIVSASTSFPSCDRVKLYNTGGAGPTYTATQSTDAPDDFKYSFKIETTSADTSLPAAHQTIIRLGLVEWGNGRRFKYGTSSGETSTVSFFVKSSITGNQDFVIASHGSVQRHIGATFTINAANTWEYKTFTFAADTDTTNLHTTETDRELGYTIDIRPTAGTNYQGGTMPTTSWGTRANNQVANNSLQIGSTANATFQITGLQWEVGDTATPFEYRTYDDDLDACQRYFQEWTEAGSPISAGGVWYATTQTLGKLVFKKPMRTAPTMTASGSGILSSYSVGTAVASNDSSLFDNIRSYGCRVNIAPTASSGTAGRGTMIQIIGSGAYVHADAEL